MNKELLAYDAPTTDVLLLCMESGILITSDPENNPNKGYNNGWNLGDI
jgi:hypothetical protein